MTRSWAGTPVFSEKKLWPSRVSSSTAPWVGTGERALLVGRRCGVRVLFLGIPEAARSKNKSILAATGPWGLQGTGDESSHQLPGGDRYLRCKKAGSPLQRKQPRVRPSPLDCSLPPGTLPPTHPGCFLICSMVGAGGGWGASAAPLLGFQESHEQSQRPLVTPLTCLAGSMWG